MSQRKITIPETIHIVEPLSGEPIPEKTAVISFEAFLDRVFQNRLWNRTVKHISAQLSIRNRLADARKEGKADFVIAGDDWECLKEATETPRIAAGTIDIEGYGLAGHLTPQLMPMIDAVLKAEEIR